MSEKTPLDTSGVSRDILREAIDRNKRRTPEEYLDRFRFTLCGDGAVQVTARKADAETRTVTLSGGTADTCDCHAHVWGVGRTDCRHMRAVDAHPRL